MNYSPQWEPEDLVHRSDASAAAPPWLLDRLGSEHYYRVTYSKHGTHNESVVTVYVVFGEHGYSLLTYYELFDLTAGRKHKPKTRKLTNDHVEEDRIFYGSESEARTSARIEAVLHFAHTRRFTIGIDE